MSLAVVFLIFAASGPQPWTLPVGTKLPREFLEETALLLQHGMADPRLGAKLVTADTPFGDRDGWLVPGTHGRADRLIATDGLEYDSVIPLADIAPDSLTLTNLIRNDQAHPDPMGGLHQYADGSPIVAAMAAVHGDVTLAETVLNHLGGYARSGSAREAYALARLNRAVFCFSQGDDAGASRDSRALLDLGRAKSRPTDPPLTSRFGQFFGNWGGRPPDIVQAIAEDSARRLRLGRRPPFDVGRLKGLSQQKRIELLISELDTARLHATRNPMSEAGARPMWDPDPVVRSLEMEGSAVIEPLLDVYDRDHRLTRELYVNRAIGSGTEVPWPVREVAFQVLQSFLARADQFRNFQDGRRPSPTQLRDLFKTYAAGGAPPFSGGRFPGYPTEESTQGPPREADPKLSWNPLGSARLPTEIVEAVNYLLRRGLADPRGGTPVIAYAGPYAKVAGWAITPDRGFPVSLAGVDGLLYKRVYGVRRATWQELREAAEQAVRFSRWGASDPEGDRTLTMLNVMAALHGDVAIIERLAGSPRPWQSFTRIEATLRDGLISRSVACFKLGDDDDARADIEAAKALIDNEEPSPNLRLGSWSYLPNHIDFSPKPAQNHPVVPNGYPDTVNFLINETERRIAMRPRFLVDLGRAMTLPVSERVPILIAQMENIWDSSAATKDPLVIQGVDVATYTASIPRNFEGDEVFKDIVFQGFSIVEALLTAYEKDRRYSRAASRPTYPSGGAPSPDTTFYSVREIALTALRRILPLHAPLTNERPTPGELWAYWHKVSAEAQTSAP